MKSIYEDETYLKNNPTWHEEDADFKSEKILKILNRNTFPFETVCEIGCGSGEILVRLSQKLRGNIKFFGFDISPHAIDIANQKKTDNMVFEQKDITKELQHLKFDLLLVIDVIEHIENYFDFLKSVKPIGQYTIFHIPLDICLWTLFREQILIESKDRVGHIHNFTEAFIKSILTDLGFSIIDFMYTEPVFKSKNVKEKTISITRKILFKINKRFCTKTIGGYSILVLAKNNNQ